MYLDVFVAVFNKRIPLENLIYRRLSGSNIEVGATFRGVSAKYQRLDGIWFKVGSHDSVDEFVVAFLDGIVQATEEAFRRMVQA